MAYPTRYPPQKSAIPATWKTPYNLYEEKRAASSSKTVDDRQGELPSLADTIQVKGISIAGWKIETQRGSIADSKTIDTLSDTWGIPLPEMPFDKNRLVLQYQGEGKSGKSWEYTFDSLRALQTVDGVRSESALNGMNLDGHTRQNPRQQFSKPINKSKRVQVAYANEWGKKRNESENHQLPGGGVTSSNFGPQAVSLNAITSARDFDWTYSCTWPGCETTKEQASSSMAAFHPSTTDRIPIERLGPPQTPGAAVEPILFFDDLILYEDELGDNGTSMLNVKVRVMPTGFLVLQRFFLRVDNVVFRVFDTRMYVGFYNNEEAMHAANDLSRLDLNAKANHAQQQSRSSATSQQMRVIRECNGFQSSYSHVRSFLPPYKANDLSPLTDIGWVSQTLMKIAAAGANAAGGVASQQRFHPGTTVSLDKDDPTRPAVLPSTAAPGQESNRILGEIHGDADETPFWEGQGHRIDVAIVE